MKSKSNDNHKNKLAKRHLNMLGWLAVVFLVVVGIGGNYYYHDVAWGLRAAAGLVILSVVLLVVARTTQGQAVIAFLGITRIELRKVVWPTRQEASQITCLVVGVVLLMVLVLWGVDSILMWAVSRLTG